MKRSLASVVDVVVVLTVIAAFFSGPSQAAARAADTEVPAAARDPFGMGTLYPFTTEDASLSVLPEYFVAHGLDVADATSYGNSVQAQVSEPVLQRAPGGGVRLTSVPLPVSISGSGLDSGAGDAILDWAQNLPDLVSAAYYTPTQVTVGPGASQTVFTETLDDPFKATVIVNSSFTDTITLTYAPAESGTVATCAVGHHRFNLGVYRNGVAEPLYTFPDSKIIFVFDYSNSDIDGDENDMTLKYWIPSSGQWVAANEICTPHRNRLLQTGYNKLTINPCSFSYYPAAYAGFYGVPTSGVAPLTVAFTNTSIGDVNTFAWTFGDGGTSTTVNPTHTYTVPGVYTVTLTASNGATNSHTLTRTNYITVYTPSNADFYAVPTVTARLSPVVFTNTSTGDWSTSLWSFGDGVTSTLTNPTHAYAAAGLYTVTLTVSGLGGSSTMTRPSYISVTAIPVVADFVGVPTSGVRPLTVVFSNLSTGDYNTALWDYGDGNSSVVISPTHQYTAAGVYTVSLTMSGLGGTDTMTRTSYITVTYQPVSAGFTGTPRSGVAPLSVTFVNTSTGDFDTSAWTFGDGGSSSDTDPVYTYTTPGVYTVSLTASGLGGSDTETKVSYVTVYEAANADFFGFPTSGQRPLTVVFTNTSTGSFSSSLWRFGDGTTSTAANPSHQYSAAGVYTVSLMVSGLGGSSTLTRTSYISVSYIPVAADFVGAPTSGVRPLTVVFTNTSTGDFTNSSWDFGDGGTSTSTNPTHQYTAGGVYTVSLAVSGPGGTDALTRTSYISVSFVPVAADFSGTPTSGVAPLRVTFTNLSTGDFDTSAWTFGDGGSSSDTDPVYTYTAAGVYTVSLTASGPGGSDTETKVSYITVYEAANADFYGFPTSGQRPLTVVFTNTSTGSFSSSLWWFGDGTTSTSTNPSHQYSAAGVYTVSLTVSGLGGSSTLTRTGYITVSFIPVVADFYGLPTSGQRPLSVVFTNTSTGDFTNSSWDFGDGGTSTSVNATHQYTAAGVYTVSLAVSGPGGSDALTRTSYITVTHIPVAADFSGTPTSGAAPLGVTFTNLSTGDFDTSAWTFGDGGSSSDTNPVYTYTTPGVYTVSLTASGPGGSDTETKTSYITVYAPANADFVGFPTSGERPLTVVFTNTSTGSFSNSLWHFGDGGTSTSTNPSHQYTAAGVYTVSLVVSGMGSTSAVTRTSYITVNYASVTADFLGAPTSGIRPLTVVFTNTSTGDFSSSAWVFGDGGTSSATNPSHQYTTAGLYTVTLTVSGPGGTDALTRTSYISVTALPVAADFWGTPTRGLAPLEVTFTNTSTGDYDTCAWTFGDGGSSAATDPVYSYTATGVYTVSLQVSGPGGTDTATKTSYITVDDVGGSTVVDPVTGGSAVFSYSLTGTVEVLVSTGSVSEDVTLGFTPVATTTTGPGTFTFGNVAFTLDAYVNGIFQEDFAFLKPIAITINYSDEDVAGISETTLRLFKWDDDTSTWIDVVETCSPHGNYLRYPDYNQFTVSLCHLCQMGMFGWTDDHTVFMPNVWKDQ